MKMQNPGSAQSVSASCASHDNKQQHNLNAYSAFTACTGGANSPSLVTNMLSLFCSSQASGVPQQSQGFGGFTQDIAVGWQPEPHTLLPAVLALDAVLPGPPPPTHLSAALQGPVKALLCQPLPFMAFSHSWLLCPGKDRCLLKHTPGMTGCTCVSCIWSVPGRIPTSKRSQEPVALVHILRSPIGHFVFGDNLNSSRWP